jgi:hypothetical protein
MEVGDNELAMTLDAPTDAEAVRFAALCGEIRGLMPEGAE